MHSRIKSIIFILLYYFSFSEVFAQTDNYYHGAFSQIDSMLLDKRTFNFKKAVLLTKNAYYSSNFVNFNFNQEIDILSEITQVLINTNSITYNRNEKDKTIILKHANLFKTITDTIT